MIIWFSLYINQRGIEMKYKTKSGLRVEIVKGEVSPVEDFPIVAKVYEDYGEFGLFSYNKKGECALSDPEWDLVRADKPKYQTRSGLPARIVSTRAGGSFPVVVIVDDGTSDVVGFYTSEGKYNCDGTVSALDLVRVKQ